MITVAHFLSEQYSLFDSLRTLPFSLIPCGTATLSVLRVQIRNFQVMRGFVSERSFFHPIHFNDAECNEICL